MQKDYQGWIAALAINADLQKYMCIRNTAVVQQEIVPLAISIVNKIWTS